ncbi:MAG: hypothetical protein ACTJIB_17540 [Pseudoalteromonas prydzensis]|uniref:DUF2178 domain-containing protein n=1 Tax=Pseudoalteromonas prydzensis TaxID=182141 RepID=A0ABR9FQ93_9GAMM|nr:hypothetical protein [Pseudoalteromonas prydzensis]MBE0459017.1 hypothetical protein [Pseudoalteromonas prydzensis]
MKQQDIKTEEKFMSQNIWLSISTSMVFLLLSVYSLIKQDNEGLLIVGMVFFYGVIVVIYLIKGGFPLKMYFQYAYKDEFLNTIDTSAYKHSIFALVFCLLGIFYKGDAIASEVSHATMAVFYLGIMLLVYGTSLLWQSRD